MIYIDKYCFYHYHFAYLFIFFPPFFFLKFKLRSLTARKGESLERLSPLIFDYFPCLLLNARARLHIKDVYICPFVPHDIL